MTDALGYIRVSTMEQLEGGGLDIQRGQVESHCDRHGLNLVGCEVDEGLSGALEDRLGLATLFERVRDGECQVVVFPRLDRLARDMLVQEIVLRDLWRLGVDVQSCAESESALLKRDDGSDPGRKMMRQIMGAVAEYERAIIVARMKGGRRRKIANGGYAGGPVPYGWRLVAGGRLAVCPEEAQIMQSMVARRNDDKWTLAQIAGWMNLCGFPSRAGGEWTHSSVRRALRSWEICNERLERETA